MNYFFILLLFISLHSIHGENTAENNLVEEKDYSYHDLVPDERIIGGTPVTLRNRPYSFVARLNINFGIGSNTICSGVVLSTKHILTVAHCLSKPGLKAKSVWANIFGGGIYLFTSSDIIIHEDYKGLYGADIALLTKKSWNREIFMRGYGNLPSLPEAGGTNVYDDKPAVIAGWGKFTDTSNFSFKLRYANVFIEGAGGTCGTTFSEVIQSMPNDELICTKWNGAGLCAGDWGGPLLVDNKLIGLGLVRKIDSCSSDSPSGFIKIERYIDWLKKNGVP